MARQLPNEVFEAMIQPQTNLLLLAFLRVNHDGRVLRFVNNSQAVTRTDGVRQPFPFSVALPADGNITVPVLQVTILNVSLEVSAFARQAVGDENLMKGGLFIVDYEVPETNLIAHEDYDILNVRYNMNSLSFEMRLHYTLD